MLRGGGPSGISGFIERFNVHLVPVPDPVDPEWLRQYARLDPTVDRAGRNAVSLAQRTRLELAVLGF